MDDKHLSFEDIEKIVGETDFSTSYYSWFETVHMHLGKCEECQRKLDKYLFASEIIDDFDLEATELRKRMHCFQEKQYRFQANIFEPQIYVGKDIPEGDYYVSPNSRLRAKIYDKKSKKAKSKIVGDEIIDLYDGEWINLKFGVLELISKEDQYNWYFKRMGF